MSTLPVPVPPPAEENVDRYPNRKSRNGLKMSVDEVKETLHQEMVAEFLAMNNGMMCTGMDTKGSLRREIMTEIEINTVLMGAIQDAKEYLHEEMAAEIKAALIGVAVGRL